VLFCLLADQWLTKPIKEEVDLRREAEEAQGATVEGTANVDLVVVGGETGEAGVIEMEGAVVAALTRNPKEHGCPSPS